jgi:hypothetical protein
MKVLIQVFVAVFLMSFGCQADRDFSNPKHIEKDFEENLRGVYNVKLGFEADTISKDPWEQMGNSLLNAYLSMIKFNATFRDDNNGEFEIFGKQLPIEWKMEGNKLNLMVLDSLGKKNPDNTQIYEVQRFDGNYDEFVLIQGDSLSGFKGFIFKKIGLPLK